MSFDVNFYVFSKKSNSTRRPPAGGAELHATCYAVEPTGVLNPTIRVKADNPTLYNYCYITKFNRYYYVREWTADNGTWLAHLAVDPLATYKEEIGAADLYVLRASAEQDGTYTDTLYPVGNDAQRQTDAHDSQWAASFANGWFVVGVVGTGSTTGASYYVMSPAQFMAFNDYMFSSIDWMHLDAEEISENLGKALINPYQYIVSCKWFPVEPPVATTEDSVSCGWWSIPCACRRLNALGSSYTTQTFTITKHPQGADRGMYLYAAPYTELRLEIPPFGLIELNATSYADVANVFASIDVDFISGEAILRIYPGTSGGSGAVCTNRLNAQLAVDIPVTQLAVDAQGATNSIGSGLSSLGGGNFLGAAASIGDAVTSLILPTVQTTGGIKGTMASMAHTWKLHTVCWPVPEDDNDHRGRPLLKNRTPASLGGYILAADGDIEAPATAAELAEIKSAIESGFFYE